MKNYFTLLIVLIAASKIFSQIPFSASFRISADTIKMENYKTEEGLSDKFKTVKLKVAYGDFEIINKKEIEQIRHANIAKIELVYTEYPKDKDFRELNKKRIEYLHLLCPEIFAGPVTRWSIIGLTKCNSDYEASNMFHGFVITYMPGATLESAKDEHDYLKDVMLGKVKLVDSTLIKIFKRNYWAQAAVVADFTGSMSPYISQLLLWYNLTFTEKKYSEFTFFNDGDMKPDDSKRVGAAGGIYYCKSENRDSVLNTALTCVSNGFGGDIPENNIEAILYTIKKNPGIKEVILIADNWAPMRDYSLIDKIKVPVRVIVCGYGMNPYLNTQYLDLAYKTKGSLHTIEEDITKLMEVNEGKIVKIGKEEFKLTGGKFYRML
jgi:hypothetical protein